MKNYSCGSLTENILRNTSVEYRNITYYFKLHFRVNEKQHTRATNAFSCYWGLPQTAHTVIDIGCFRSNLPYFGTKVITLNNTGTTRNIYSYIRSWTVTKILMPESVVFLRFHILDLLSMTCYLYTVQIRPWADSQAKPCGGACAVWSTWKPKDDFYKISSSFSYLTCVFLSLGCYLYVTYKC